MTRFFPSGAGLLLLVFVVLSVTLQWFLPHQAFWSNDGGEKLVQVKALVASRFASPALPYDPLELEPTGSFEFAPFLPGHARVIDGHLLSVVPVYFPLLSALSFGLWGHGGLYLLPLLGTLLALGCLLLLARSLGDEHTAALTVAAAGLASPLFFYSLTFWEHTLAAGLCTASILLLHRGHTGVVRISFRALAAGLLLTLAAWLRGEVVVLLLACGLTMLLCRNHRRLLPSFILGIGGALLPYLLINHQLYATAVSPQLPGGGSAVPNLTLRPLLSRWQDIATYLLTGYLDLPWLNRLFLLLGVAPALILSLLRQPSARRDALAVTWIALVCLSALATLGRLFFLESPMASSMTILGLFGSLPFLPLALVRPSLADPEQGQALRFLALVALLGLTGLCLGLPSRGGLQWGPRYALPLMPLLIFLAVAGFARLRQTLTSPAAQRTCTALFLLLILAGTGIQGFGVHLLFAKKQASLANMDRIRAMAPRVLITDTWWVPEDNGELYGTYPLYAFYTFEKMGRLLSLLARKGQRELLLVSSADYREFIARQPGLSLISFAQTHHPGLEMFNLSLHTIRLDQTP